MKIDEQAGPRAILHIGPHKTSSSHIQTFITSNEKILESENLYWPRERNGNLYNAKEVAYLAAALRDNSKDPHSSIDTIKLFLKESLAQNRSVILSSEEFDTESGGGIHQLQDMLRGFDVTVVYVYRELLTHMISLYFELNRFEHDVHYCEPFSTYLLKNLDHVSTILDPMPLLRDYGAAFGRENITVIDLHGCQVDAQDITYVVICEVAGVLCDRPAVFRNRNLNANAAYSLVSSEVFSAYNAHVENQLNGTCHHCERLRDAHKTFEIALRARLAQRGAPTLPLIRSGLGMLVPFAEQMDATLRAHYGDRILHGSAAASLEVMRRHVHVESLDLAAFLTNKDWAAWMRETFYDGLVQGQICGCVLRR